jgi:branched-chain amino acid transport system permease protein
MKFHGRNYLIGIAIAAVVPLIANQIGGMAPYLLIIIGIFSILAVSLNLIMGYTGQANMAHGVLFGVGAYTSGILVLRYGVNFWATIPIAGIVAVGAGFVIGYASLRLRGLYFAITTMAFLFLMVSMFTNLRGLTGGARGLYPIPPASIFGIILSSSKQLIWIYLIFAFLLFTIFVIDRIINSRTGRALIAICEDEDFARSTGINTFWYKMLSFCIATFFAGIAGALYSSYIGTVAPANVSLVPTVVIIASCAVGGLGTLIGPIIGTIVMTLLPELLRPISEYYYVIFSVLLICIVIFMPTGIMGAISQLPARIKARGSKEG